MRILLTFTLLFSLNAQAMSESRYFERPLSCPLRFSSLTTLRDQVQVLVASLGNGCTKENQQAINSLNSNVANLEGIYNSYSSYNTNGSNTTAQYAKNVGQVLGNINLITSNNACFYDIKSRGVLPVLGDVIMSASQLGLLVPSATGTIIAAGGFIAGSSLKIINELVKKKFNFNKPEERRAFIQLNCAFFDSRRLMEESGIFNPETEEFREDIVNQLRRERVELLKLQKKQESDIKELDEMLTLVINNLPGVEDKNLDPVLARTFDEVTTALAFKPADYSQKLRQVTYLNERINKLIDGSQKLVLETKAEPARQLLLSSLLKIQDDLVPNGKAWSSTIDDYEMNVRGPLMAFIGPVSDALKKELASLESELVVNDLGASKDITRLRIRIKEGKDASWGIALRLSSLDAKITSLDNKYNSRIFSDQDEGTSNAVELLDYYRKLQSSILGREGKDYLKNAIKVGFNMKEGLEHQLSLFKSTTNQRERCSAAEKTRFAWTQYRYKIQEVHDFVATNLDLYRSSFRIGKERQKRATSYVLAQIDSVEDFLSDKRPADESAGYLMKDVANKVKDVEILLHASGCF
ncbi:hypothetical protein [Peredibacter starrii]|uniref:Uncharacterized protein n=1 Tax=Peredibacter starrii TaxID=28202 RepID=A0AAX4HMK8_9BACT|nr:hypothetical protein [Peredibacter starrii]WPU64436.1 hypothetical protein SOO65_17215 [Peredibacter starrii]